MEPAIKIRIARGKLKTNLALLSLSSERKASRMKTLKYAYGENVNRRKRKYLFFMFLIAVFLIGTLFLAHFFKEELMAYFSYIFPPETQ